MSGSRERQRRSRERQRRCEDGDHSMCGPRTKCPELGKSQVGAPVTSPGDVTGDVTFPSSDRVTSVPPPAGLGARGSRLWAQLSGRGFDPAHQMLLEEICRSADTLERLHAMVQADDTQWLELVRNDAESDDETTELRVVVNGLLVEQRQQQANFRQQVAELRLSGRAGSAAGQQAGQSSPGAAGATTPEPSTGEALAAPDSPAAAEGGLGDLIDAAGRFTSQG